MPPSAPTPPAAEKELTRLRKLPENRICPNCGKKDGMFGFQAICIQFRTFVCSDCKSAHQAYSHRCKSASMSNWTMEEVQSLDERNGGGNKVCLERYLGNCPDSARPPKDCHPDILKNFIVRAYNNKEWESADWKPAAKSAGNPRRREEAPASEQPARPRKEQPAKPASRQMPMNDLLDFDTAALPPVAAGNPAPAPSAAAPSLFDDLLFDPSSTVAAQPEPRAQQASQPAATGTEGWNPFGASEHTPPEQQTGVNAGSASPFDNFDPFAQASPSGPSPASNLSGGGVQASPISSPCSPSPSPTFGTSPWQGSPSNSPPSQSPSSNPAWQSNGFASVSQPSGGMMMSPGACCAPMMSPQAGCMGAWQQPQQQHQQNFPGGMMMSAGTSCPPMMSPQAGGMAAWPQQQQQQFPMAGQQGPNGMPFPMQQQQQPQGSMPQQPMGGMPYAPQGAQPMSSPMSMSMMQASSMVQPGLQPADRAAFDPLAVR